MFLVKFYPSELILDKWSHMVKRYDWRVKNYLRIYVWRNIKYNTRGQIILTFIFNKRHDQIEGDYGLEGLIKKIWMDVFTNHLDQNSSIVWNW